MANGVDVSTNTMTDFSDSELQTLAQCEEFARMVFNITSDLRQNKHTEKELPIFPKSELLKIMGIVPKTQKKIRGLQLHENLKTKIVTEDRMDEIPDPPNYQTNRPTMDDFLLCLKNGYSIIQNIKAKSIHLSLNYGAWLNVAFRAYEYNKGKGLLKESWAFWLKKNIGISDSYARKLRELATEFIEYKRIHSLAIPISELWNQRQEISQMLLSDPDIWIFWKGE